MNEWRTNCQMKHRTQPTTRQPEQEQLQSLKTRQALVAKAFQTSSRASPEGGLRGRHCYIPTDLKVQVSVQSFLSDLGDMTVSKPVLKRVVADIKQKSDCYSLGYTIDDFVDILQLIGVSGLKDLPCGDIDVDIAKLLGISVANRPRMFHQETFVPAAAVNWMDPGRRLQRHSALDAASQAEAQAPATAPSTPPSSTAPASASFPITQAARTAASLESAPSEPPSVTHADATGAAEEPPPEQAAAVSAEAGHGDECDDDDGDPSADKPFDEWYDYDNDPWAMNRRRDEEARRERQQARTREQMEAQQQAEQAERAQPARPARARSRPAANPAEPGEPAEGDDQTELERLRSQLRAANQKLSSSRRMQSYWKGQAAKQRGKYISAKSELQRALENNSYHSLRTKKRKRGDEPEGDESGPKYRRLTVRGQYRMALKKNIGHTSQLAIVDILEAQVGRWGVTRAENLFQCSIVQQSRQWYEKMQGRLKEFADKVKKITGRGQAAARSVRTNAKKVYSWAVHSIRGDDALARFNIQIGCSDLISR